MAKYSHPLGQTILVTSHQNRLNTLKKILIDHVFNWKILSAAPSQKHLMKDLEAIFVELYQPSLNDKKSFDRLMLFRNGIT